MNEKGKKTIRAVKKTTRDIKKHFSEKTDKVADIIVDKNDMPAGERSARVRKETVDTFKGAFESIKRNTKGLGIKDVLNDASFALGRISHKTKKSCSRFFKGLF